MSTKNKWISVTDELPDELQTVWACDMGTGYVKLACIIYDYEYGFLWSISNGVIYSENGIIISECELDDDYSFTHWQPLPELPNDTGNE